MQNMLFSASHWRGCAFRISNAPGRKIYVVNVRTGELVYSYDLETWGAQELEVDHKYLYVRGGGHLGYFKRYEIVLQ